MARKEERRDDSDSGDAKRPRRASTDSDASETPLLTPEGVRMLRAEVISRLADGIVLQVLSVHRYLVDPALKQFLLEHDAVCASEVQGYMFDVVLSDGRLKTKCVLAPKMNHLVRTGKLAAHSILRVSQCIVEVMRKSMGDDNSKQRKRRVCLLQELEVLPGHGAKFLVYPNASSQQMVERENDDGLNFASTASKRDTELLPVVGERECYLALTSDHYILDPQTERTHTRCDLPSLFVPGTRTLYSLKEISGMIDDVADMDKRVRARIRRSYPPMTGVVRVKSKVTHFGDPAVANPFPFVFHIVLVDKNSAVEVAFFGSMCAQYFDVIQEGDLIQLRGYSVSVDVAGDASNPSDLFFFEHESPGEVFHVPTKHWMLLETTGLLKKPVFLSSSDKAEMASRGGVNSQSPSTDDPLWLECNFATTLNMQHWSDEILEERESFYFDFVGVLSFVGRVEIPLFRYPSRSRWLKAVDSTSSTELIILLEDCMQAKLFRSLQAGDMIMLTKLQLDAALPSTEGLTKQQPSNGALYARSSTFTVLRANEEVRAFNGIEECRLNSLFADSLVSKVQVKRKPSTGESWLEGESMTQYQTRLAIPADPEIFASVHDLRVVSVSNVSMYTKDMMTKTFTTVRIGVVGHLVSLAIDTNEDDDENGPSRIEIEIGDDNQTMKNNNKPSLKATLSASPIFDVLKKQNETMLKHITPAVSKRILETLAPSLVDEILAMTPIKKAMLSVPVTHIEQQLVKPNRMFLFSTRLYRTAQGSLQIDVEAIVPYTP